HADRCVLPDRRAARRALAPRSRGGAVSRPGMSEPPQQIKAAIRDAALALGFDAVGFAPPTLAAEAREHLGEYLARGYHGDMGWLAARADERASPDALWPEARTVVVLGLN